jgi:para-aminobenzoate synthetase component 1
VALDWTVTASEAVRRWPESVPLVCLTVPGGSGGDGAGWTILTTPRGDEVRHGFSPPDWMPTSGTGGGAWGGVPFVGGWIGVLDYEAGFEVEPSAGAAVGESVTWMECPAALLHDGATNQWWRVGDSVELPQLQGLRARGREVRSWRCGGLTSVQGRGHYEAAVARTVEYTRAGDVFQANIAHQLRTSFEGSARGLFARLMESARPRHGAFVEMGDERTVCSMSPELFLDADFRKGVVRTRPIKGTRPVARADELRASEKDGAELVMIVDLMRNDLGRVCRFGSVRVDRSRVIERHGPIVHGVGSVSGVMREGTSVEALMRAAFPAGSVTGAPKVRAMQIIQELEGFRRGAYCGSVGFVSRCGRSVWNVGIRTATIIGDELVYPVGAGIVEGSVPALEWEETLHKAEGFMKVLREGEAGVARSRVVTPGVAMGVEGVR